MAIVVTNYIHYDTVARRVGAEAAHGLAVETTLATMIHATVAAPVRTAQLRLSVRHRVRRVGLESHGTVWYPVDYAMSVHEGARSHIIRPRDPNGILRFRQNGRIRYAKMVRHPGQRANPWLYRALVREAGRRSFIVTPR